MSEKDRCTKEQDCPDTDRCQRWGDCLKALKKSPETEQIQLDRVYWRTQGVERILDRLQIAADTMQMQTRLLRRIANANVIFPSMCANNMEAMNLLKELNKYKDKP